MSIYGVICMFVRMCWMHGGHQERPVPPGPGQPLALVLLQLHLLQQTADFWVHGQVGKQTNKTNYWLLSTWPSGYGSLWVWWHFTITCSRYDNTVPIFCSNNKPYCESCYNTSFGVVCSACRKFITGKVLEVRLFIHQDTGWVECACVCG